MRLFDEKTIDTFSYIIYGLFVLSTSIALVGYFPLHPESLIVIGMKVIRFLCYGSCLALIIYNLVHRIYSLNALLIYAALAFAFGLFTVIAGDSVLAKALLLSGIVYKKDFKKLVKITLFIQMLILFGVIVLAQAGLIDNYVQYESSRTRDYLGFVYTSFPGFFLFFIVLLYAQIRRNRVTIFEYGAMAAAAYYIYSKTVTRNAFLITVLFIAIMILGKALPEMVRKITGDKKIKLIRWFPLLMAITAVALTMAPQTEIWYMLNRIVSNRLILGRNQLLVNGVTVFGKDLLLQGTGIDNLHVENYSFVDSSYIQFIIHYGLCSLAGVLFIYDELMNKAIRNADFQLLAGVLVIAGMCVFEPYLYDIVFNLFPILAFSGYCCFEDNKQLNKISDSIRNQFPLIHKITESQTK